MLSDKVTIVAGAGTGLGEAAAVELGRQGAKVVVNDLGVDVTGEGESEEPAEQTIERVKDAGGDGMAHFGDVSSLDYTERLIQDTYDEYGRVDGVVNFAGILRDSISYRMSGEEWDTVMNVHLRGHFSLLRNAAAHWREEISDDEAASQRSILNVSSRSALGSIGQANYSAAKAGILGLTRSTSRELFRHNIRVNALMPTAFTRMIAAIPEEKRPFTEEEMPPEKVAPMVAYMMSDEAEDITGCTLRAAGDEIGLLTNPELHRIGYTDGGWTPQEIADRFRDTVASGINVTKTEREW
jgi:3-oxoacyl-[acyl-carrier protein] reductase